MAAVTLPTNKPQANMTHTDINRSDIDSAISRLDKGWRHFLRQTPLWQLSGRAMGLNCGQVWLKLEHLQVGGSFKARGMLNRMLAQPIPAAGVVIASGGNAGIAAAAAAQALGVPCEVFVSAVSSQAKRDRLRQLGAAVTVAGEGYTQAYEACLARQPLQHDRVAIPKSGASWQLEAGAGTLGQAHQAGFYRR